MDRERQPPSAFDCYHDNYVHVCLSAVRPRDCSDVMTSGITEDGVYSVFPVHQPDGFMVYCDMTTDGGGWTVCKHAGHTCQPGIRPPVLPLVISIINWLLWKRTQFHISCIRLSFSSPWRQFRETSSRPQRQFRGTPGRSQTVQVDVQQSLNTVQGDVPKS